MAENARESGTPITASDFRLIGSSRQYALYAETQRDLSDARELIRDYSSMSLRSWLAKRHAFLSRTEPKAEGGSDDAIRKYFARRVALCDLALAGLRAKKGTP